MSRRRSERLLVRHVAATLAVAGVLIVTPGGATSTPVQRVGVQTSAALGTPALATVVPARWHRPPRPQVAPPADPCSRRYRVAVIDMFYPGDYSFGSRRERDQQFQMRDAVDVDGDGVRDPYYHGDIVSLYAGDPAIEIVPYNVGNLTTAKEQIARHLATIQDQVEHDEGVDAILLAWESSTLISSLGDPILSTTRRPTRRSCASGATRATTGDGPTRSSPGWSSSRRRVSRSSPSPGIPAHA